MPDEYHTPRERIRNPKKNRIWIIVSVFIALIVIIFLWWWFNDGGEVGFNTNGTNTTNSAESNTNQGTEQNGNVNWTLDMPETQEFTNAPSMELEIIEGQ
ncbi:hypothetical protein KKA01_02130 [Patescibacteria group bacterium]|nr:hypothetical protein [Patescibacteria group bacterium]